MFRVLIALFLHRLVFSAKPRLGDENIRAVTPELLDEINSKTSLWKASIPVRFENASVADVKRQLGTIMPGEEGYITPLQPVKLFEQEPLTDIPESFDARTAWPECAGIIGHIRDQSNCGSCWAFASTEAFNDRYCIATKDYKTLFSPEDTNSCCSGLSCSFSQGCNGGQPSGAWHWFTVKGVSSGGDYTNVDDGTSCKPYSFQACAHHATPPEGMVPCEQVHAYNTLKCASKCSDHYYETSYTSDKRRSSESYQIVGEKHMQLALMDKGTLSVAIEVYADFEAYTSGIYHHVSGAYLGGHAIKLIGWGVEDGTPYWICVNSWNTMWGEGGTFRILRGQNEVGIESSTVAGDIHVNK
eukprot:gene3061-6001_t